LHVGVAIAKHEHSLIADVTQHRASCPIHARHGYAGATEVKLAAITEAMRPTRTTDATIAVSSRRFFEDIIMPVRHAAGGAAHAPGMTDILPLVPSPVELAPAASVRTQYTVMTPTGPYGSWGIRDFAVDFLDNGYWKPAQDCDDDGNWSVRIGLDGEDVMEQVTPLPPARTSPSSACTNRSGSHPSSAPTAMKSARS
jgi:hypothetical protein